MIAVGLGRGPGGRKWGGGGFLINLKSHRTADQ